MGLQLKKSPANNSRMVIDAANRWRFVKVIEVWMRLARCIKRDDGSTSIFMEIPAIKRVLKTIKGE